jgi:glycosyltransferase involved in cell wall biosynthesis
MPEISVILPVYNAGLHLSQSIISILEQKFSDFEFIIIDDASTDGSYKTIQSFSDDRIKSFKNTFNQGLIGTLNRALDLATGKYVARMDQDDISHPERLQVQYKFLSENHDVVLCGAAAKIIDTEETVVYPTDHENIRIGFLEKNMFIHPTVFFNRNILSEYRYDTNYKSAEDYELFFRISQKHKVANIEEVLLDYRVHSTQISTADSSTQSTTADKVRLDMVETLLHRRLTKIEKEMHLALIKGGETPIKPKDMIHWIRLLNAANHKKALWNEYLFIDFISQKFIRYTKQYYLWGKKPPMLSFYYPLRYKQIRVNLTRKEWLSSVKRKILK